MFRKLADGFRRFFYGRYGTDQLGTFLLAVGLVLLLLGSLWLPLLILPSYLVLIYYLFRCYSKNIPARRRENARFLRLTAPIRDRQHRYFRCPTCRQSVRVPRGKGRITITCPKCRARFEKNS